MFEKTGFHNFRHRYLLGRLASRSSTVELREYLRNKGFHSVGLARRDPGEIFSIRKIDKGIYQHPVRFFSGGEIREHYEYLLEFKPIARVMGACSAHERTFY